MGERLIVVDEDDNIIKIAERKEVLEKKLLHRGAGVFLFNKEGKLFIHKRSEDKETFPGCYDSVVGGGSREGEEYEETAKRELQEEAGIKAESLEFMFDFRFEGKESRHISKVYKYITDETPEFVDGEIESGAFYTFDEVKEIFKTNPVIDDGKILFEKLIENEKIKNI